MVQIVGNSDSKIPPAHLIVDKLDLQITFMHQTDHTRAKVGEGKIRGDFLVQTVDKFDPKMSPAHLIVDKLDLQIIFMHQTDHIRAKVEEGKKN